MHLTADVVITNVPRKIGLTGLRSCWNAAQKRGDVLMFQECLTMRQRNEYHRLMKRDGFAQVGLWTTPNPIFFRKSKWRVRRRNRILLHRRDKSRLGRKYKGYGSARSATIGVCRPVKNGKMVPKTRGTSFVNSHLVARGAKTDPNFRKKARAASQKKLNQIRNRQIKRLRVTIFGGDWNDLVIPKISGVHWVHSGIDRIGIVAPKEDQIIRQNGSSFPSKSDHGRGKRARFVFKL